MECTIGQLVDIRYNLELNFDSIDICELAEGLVLPIIRTSARSMDPIGSATLLYPYSDGERRGGMDECRQWRAVLR